VQPQAAPETPTYKSGDPAVNHLLEAVAAKANTMPRSELDKMIQESKDPEIIRLYKDLQEEKAQHQQALAVYRALEHELLALTWNKAHPDQKKVEEVRQKMSAQQDELYERVRHINDLVMTLTPSLERKMREKYGIYDTSGVAEPKGT